MAVAPLTAATVAAIKPPASGRVDYADARCPGLELRVSHSGAKTWTFRYRPQTGGGPVRLTIGKASEVSLADARAKVAQIRARVIDGADPQKEKKLRRVAAQHALTFDTLADRYIEDYAKARKRSWQNDVIYLKRARERFGTRPAEEITRRDVILLLDDIAATAPVSANRTQTILSKLFSWAAESELVPSSPIVGLRKRAIETPKDRTLDDDEIRVLWRGC